MRQSAKCQSLLKQNAIFHQPISSIVLTPLHSYSLCYFCFFTISSCYGNKVSVYFDLTETLWSVCSASMNQSGPNYRPRRVWSTCCFLYHLNSTGVTLQDRAWKQPQRRWAIFILKSGGIGQDKGGRGGDLSSSSNFQSYLQWIDWPHVMGKGELAQTVQFQTAFFLASFSWKVWFRDTFDVQFSARALISLVVGSSRQLFSPNKIWVICCKTSAWHQKEDRNFWWRKFKIPSET